MPSGSRSPSPGTAAGVRARRADDGPRASDVDVHPRRPARLVDEAKRDRGRARPRRDRGRRLDHRPRAGGGRHGGRVVATGSRPGGGADTPTRRAHRCALGAVAMAAAASDTMDAADASAAPAAVPHRAGVARRTSTSAANLSQFARCSSSTPCSGTDGRSSVGRDHDPGPVFGFRPCGSSRSSRVSGRIGRTASG